MEITVQGSARNVVHRNLILVLGTSAEEGYKRAADWGFRGEASYENPAGQAVEIKFRGISKLDAVIDELDDGAELTFEEIKGVEPAEIARWIPLKEHLEAFRSPRPFGETSDPDYSSRRVVDRVTEHLSGAGPQPRKEGPRPKVN